MKEGFCANVSSVTEQNGIIIELFPGSPLKSSHKVANGKCLLVLRTHIHHNPALVLQEKPVATFSPLLCSLHLCILLAWW